MSTAETSDRGLLDLLRESEAMSVLTMAAATGVTQTAVRQRLTRLMAQGLIEREVAPALRGRPSHRYLLTEKGKLAAGNNFGDLAMVLWNEVRAISDAEVRRGLLQRISHHLAEQYQERVTGTSTVERMQNVQQLFAERGVPFVVDQSQAMPVLTALACPYPQLAEQDRGVCAMEKMLLSELIGENVKLAACRLDGDSCCRFETKSVGDTLHDSPELAVVEPR